jgi:hypothetical protein
VNRRDLLRLGALAVAAPKAMAAPVAQPVWYVVGGMTLAEIWDEMDRQRQWEAESLESFWMSQASQFVALAKKHYVPAYSGDP